MKSASRTTAVVGGAVGGGIVGGPVGFVVGASAGGVTADGVTTVVESKIQGEFRPNGTF